jgi:ADP-ribosylglycohydrolase
MVSDDTEHACITAQALVASAGDPDVFARELARRLRWWLFALPPGVGFATLRGILKTTIGISPGRSGVHSAGNGPAMRAPLLGAAIDDTALLRELVHRSTVVTHTDPRAEWGALAVALAARHARLHATPDGDAFLAEVERELPAEAMELLQRIRLAVEHVRANGSVTEFPARLGLEHGVSGFVEHTVPVALCAWLRHPDDITRVAIECVRCGGDTDSVAAIACGIAGASPDAQPSELLARLAEWPRNVRWMTALGAQTERVMASHRPEHVRDVPFAAALGRNLFLLVVVLVHAVRRGLPPY